MFRKSWPAEATETVPTFDCDEQVVVSLRAKLLFALAEVAGSKLSSLRARDRVAEAASFGGKEAEEAAEEAAAILRSILASKEAGIAGSRLSSLEVRDTWAIAAFEEAAILRSMACPAESSEVTDTETEPTTDVGQREDAIRLRPNLLGLLFAQFSFVQEFMALTHLLVAVVVAAAFKCER